MIKIAVVGTGIIGGYHLEQITTNKNYKLCAVCDINEEVAKDYSEKYGVPYFTDYKDIPKSVDIDAVIINLPHFLHCESTVFFLDSGIHVLLEKPMANTVEECDKMIEASNRSGKRLGIAHSQRFFEHNIEIKKLVNSGIMGEFCMFSEFRSVNYFLESRPRWFLDKAKAGGGISMNYGAHTVDKLFSLLGVKDVRVSGTLGNFVNKESIEGHVQMHMDFCNGSSASVTFYGYDHIPWVEEYYFTKGVIRKTEFEPLMYRTDGDWIVLESDKNPKDFIAYQHEEFLKYINGEPSMTPDGEYGRAVIATLEQLYKYAGM